MATEKRNYNAGLNAKGLEKFVSEEQARAMCSSQGRHSLMIVDAHHGTLTVDEDGSQRINLVIDVVELVPEQHEERVRDFMRGLYLARPDQYGQAAFEAAPDGSVDVATAAAGLDAAVERDESGEVTGVWDGDPDAPMPSTAVEAPDTCPAPDCVLPEGHDGDHQPAEDTSADPASNVVAFSGNG